jgi:type IV secretion system protein VirB8
LAAVAACGALVGLMPLKRVEPFVIRVDNSTGVVDVVPVYAGQAAMAETVTRYLLTHYVSVCERFTYATAESDYEECGAFHSPQRNQAWYAAWNPNNPQSPLNLYKDGTTVRAQVESVSFFKRGSGVEDLAYTAPSGDPKIRRWNPLGFKVIEFRSEAEVLPEVSPPSATGASVAGSTSSRRSP